jgi:uncharacterized membrane protein YwaF
MTITITTPSLLDLIGPVPYWLLVVMLAGACAMWSVNAVSVCYSEIGRQIEELRRVKE